LTSVTNLESSQMYAKELAVAQSAAIAAGDYLRENLGKAQVQYEKAHQDFLLDVDLGAEKIILDQLQQAFPEYGILSEEAGRSGNPDRYWIVDPLDGSANFEVGCPLFGTVIALHIDGQTVLGLIYLPMVQEMYCTIKSAGATLNGSQMRVAVTTELANSIVHTSAYNRFNDATIVQRRIAEFGKLYSATKIIRITGTTAMDLAFVAAGRAVGLVAHTHHPWDIDAGTLLVQEAGGEYSELTTGEERTLKIWSNGQLHQSLVAAMTKD